MLYISHVRNRIVVLHRMIGRFCLPLFMMGLIAEFGFADTSGAADKSVTVIVELDSTVIAPAATEKDPFSEIYPIDGPKFDPALYEKSSESTTSSEETETSENSHSSESTANSDSGQPSESTQRSATQSQSAHAVETDKSETDVPKNASASTVNETQADRPKLKQASAASGSKQLSDEAQAHEQISGGGAMLPERDVSVGMTEQLKTEPGGASASAPANGLSAPNEPGSSAGSQEVIVDGAGGGLNLPAKQRSASTDKTDHSRHDHVFISDRHVEGAEEPPLKKTKPLHWNMQRQVRKTVVE